MGVPGQVTFIAAPLGIGYSRRGFFRVWPRAIPPLFFSMNFVTHLFSRPG